MSERRHPWLARIINSDPLAEVVRRLDAARRAAAVGARGSAAALLAGAVAVRTGRTVLYVVAHLDEADDAADDLQLFADDFGVNVQRFGALEVLPGESHVALDLLAERLAVVSSLSSHQTSDIRHQTSLLIGPIQALMQSVPRPDAIGDLTLTIEQGKDLSPGLLLDWLVRAGYNRADAVEEPGDFATRGGIIDIYPPTALDQAAGQRAGPIRIDYFGDTVESVRRLDPDTMRSAEPVPVVRLLGASVAQLQNDDRTTCLVDLLPKDAAVVLHEPLELAEQARGYFERLTDPRGIYAPATIAGKLTARPHVEVAQVQSLPMDPRLVVAQLPAPVTLPVEPLPSFAQDAGDAVKEAAALADTHAVVIPCNKQAELDRLRELLTEHAPAAVDRVSLSVGYVHRGFVWVERKAEEARRHEGTGARRGKQSSPPLPPPGEGQVSAASVASSDPPCLRGSVPPCLPSALPLLLLPHHELFHRYHLPGAHRRLRRGSAGAGGSGGAAGTSVTDAFIDLNVGDYVVHVDHGIARFTGIKTMRPRKGGADEADDRDTSGGGEYLTLEFAGRAVLHVPATQIDLVQKYVGGFEGKPPLSTLGGKKWAKQKEQVGEAVKDLAAELLRVQAARSSMPGLRYPADTPWQKEFEAEFPFDETDDQLAAIAAIKRDMSDEQPMDRLICGDVGFGKTEVAIRAAFKAAEFGKQVAVLVPTTVLAEQHERTFRSRMADYPFRVASLSRFKSDAEQRATLTEVAAGRIDVVIGTHRLLSADVRFADLGLVVIDEEQRFGVEHKQKLLQFRLTADVLTLSATPIPRTLHMAMIGLRDISSLATAPVDRRAVVTEVLQYDARRVKQAIARELNRDGQVFFVHNRVHDIQSVADDIQKLAPSARIVIGHGQMPPRELEEVMLKFIRHEADILVCTTIIESGIDIPNANTMFIHDADHYGLADLHQLRGRVGRYKHRAYCYLLLPEDRPVSEVASKRLRAIEQYAMLGAGFKIAMRDLEIRGAGNLLGAEQSGHIAAVGYELYCQLLEQATKRMRNQPVIEPARTHLELPVTAHLPKRWLPSDKLRMDAYRRISRASTLEELEQVQADLVDANGPMPPQAQTMFDLTQVRIAASTLGIDRIKLEGPDLIFTMAPSSATRLDPVFRDAAGRVSVIDEKSVYWRPPTNYLEVPTLLPVLRRMLVKGMG